MTTHIISEDDWPRCAKCDMPVENFVIADTGNTLTFVATCHGKEELVHIPDSMWDTEFDQTVSIGPAFQDIGEDVVC